MGAGQRGRPQFELTIFGEMGWSIAHGHGFEGFGNLIQRRAPLYPIMLGGVYFVFGDDDRVALLVHICCSTGMVAWFDLARAF